MLKTKNSATKSGQAPPPPPLPELKAELQRLASLSESVLPLTQHRQRKGATRFPPSRMPSTKHDIATAGNSSSSSCGSYSSNGSYEEATTLLANGGGRGLGGPAGFSAADDHHRPLSYTVDPPIGAPLRPRHYVCRDKLAAAAGAALLRGRVARDGSGWAEGTTVVLIGSSGAGKACLAAEVVGRRDIRAKFGDEVLWLQVRFMRGCSGLAVSFSTLVAFCLCRKTRVPIFLPKINNNAALGSF